MQNLRVAPVTLLENRSASRLRSSGELAMSLCRQKVLGGRSRSLAKPEIALPSTKGTQGQSATPVLLQTRFP
jgi:hypothetical protein